MSRGALIVLEGLDGAGTTTQARRLVEHLANSGRPAHLTREPSDGPVGKLLRALLVGDHAIPGQAIDQATFSLLFAADRNDHLQREILPAQQRGEVVVSDRYYHSSLAYQGTGAQREWIRALNRFAPAPGLTLFLRVAPEVAAARRLAAGRSQELFEDLPMQIRVAEGYDAVNAELVAAGEHVVILDGEAAPGEVTRQSIATVTDFLATH
jgi:dTMP kinase